MAKTLYTSNNFVIADDNGSQKQVSTSKSSYKEENDTFIMIDDVTRKRIVIPFSEAGEWLDAETGGSAYTEATLRTFIRANFSTASGGSGAVDNSVVYPIYSSGQSGSSGVDFWKRPPAKYYHFGHNWRFCGITGGYTDGSAYYDIDGIATTRALAFPEDVVLDLGRVDATGNFLAWQNQPDLFAVSDYATSVSNCTGFSTTTFASGWIMPTIIELFTLFYQPNTDTIQQLPFESVISSLSLWSDTEQNAGFHWSFRSQQVQAFPDGTPTLSRAFPVRLTNISEI